MLRKYRSEGKEANGRCVMVRAMNSQRCQSTVESFLSRFTTLFSPIQAVNFYYFIISRRYFSNLILNLINWISIYLFIILQMKPVAGSLKAKIKFSKPSFFKKHSLNVLKHSFSNHSGIFILAPSTCKNIC